MENKNEIIIYTSGDNKIQVEVQFEGETVWLSQKQIAEIFEVQRPAITKHLKNIFDSNELVEDAVSSKMELTASDGKTYSTKFYNLDAVLSIGYRINSGKATKFRQWATQRLKDYLVKGYALNNKRLEETKAQFIQTLEDLKLLTADNYQLETKEILTLIQKFSNTWFSLDSYDKNEFPSKGTEEEINTTVTDLEQDLEQLKVALIKKGEATELFAQEKTKGNLAGILGNVFQSVFGQDAYPTVEAKAAHLLYFIIKNHPFNDGNKRSGAFSFIWFLQKAGYNFSTKISPETLTTLTILIAESNPDDKERMIGIVLLLLN